MSKVKVWHLPDIKFRPLSGSPLMSFRELSLPTEHRDDNELNEAVLKGAVTHDSMS